MKYFLPILSLLIIIAACKKLEVPQSKEEMMRGKWQMEIDSMGKGILKERRYVLLDTSLKIVDTVYTFVTIKMKDSLVNDTMYNRHVIDWCRGDDFLEFKEGNRGELNTGAAKCPFGEVSNIEIKWGFLDNYSRMYIYDAGDMFMGNNDVVGTLKEFSGEKFVLQYMVIDNLSNIPGHDTSFYTVTFKKR